VKKKLLAKYFGEISQDTGKFCFGVKDTLQALDLGAVFDLIVWENLNINRYALRHPTTNEEKIVHLNEKQEQQNSNFKDSSGVELDVKEKQSLLEWLSQNYKNFGATLHFVTDKSQEGSQFCKGFGGIGGLLRYEVDFSQYEDPEQVDETEDADELEDIDAFI